MKTEYLGWQVGINYQTPLPEGIDLPYLKNVIDRSADAGMNFISMMMISYACHCPEHDGYAWPVANPRLKPLQDAACRNADPRREFVRQALVYAKAKKFHCQLMMNAMIWNSEKVALSYPQAARQCNAEGAPAGWLFCPDSPGGFQLALDEVTDLLRFYADSPVDSFAFERLGYNNGSCYCPYSLEKIKRETDCSEALSPTMRLAWKANAVREYLKQYVGLIHDLRPGIEVWAYTGGDPEWGHFPHVLRDAGIKIVSNHGQHILPNAKMFHQQLGWLAPLTCVLHICVRDLPTHNYAVPVKTPAMIRGYAHWLENYAGANLAGAMFFNEVRTGEPNKTAVYEIARRWRGRG